MADVKKIINFAEDIDFVLIRLWNYNLYFRTFCAWTFCPGAFHLGFHGPWDDWELGWTHGLHYYTIID